MTGTIKGATIGQPLSPGMSQNMMATMGQSDMDFNITSPPKPHFKSVKDYLKQAKTAQKEKNAIKAAVRKTEVKYYDSDFSVSDDDGEDSADGKNVSLDK